MVERKNNCMATGRTRKYAGCMVLIVFLMLYMAVSAKAAASQVYDDAGLFLQGEMTELEAAADKLRDRHHMNFVIVTTEDAKGKSAREYADDFYMDNGYYDNEERGGIELLIDMDNREVYVSTAGDMRYYITDEKVEEILDAGYPYVSDGAYARAIARMLDEADDIIGEGIQSNQYIYDEETGKIIRYRSLTGTDILIAVLVPLVLAGSACFVVCRKYSAVEKYQYSINQNANMKIRNRSDHLVNQFVTKRRIPKNPPPGNGGGGSAGSSGRTTVHTSSGGGSFGGGGRKF